MLCNVVHQPLYPNIVFPPLFTGVSTDQSSEGNARLIVDFVNANIRRHKDIYLDLHAINDAHLQTSGFRNYFGISLVATGSLWKVARSRDEFTAALLAEETNRRVVEFLEDHLPLLIGYGTGTWEHAALSISNDGLYQRGLALLTMALAEQTPNNRESIGESGQTMKDREAITATSIGQLDQVLSNLEKWETFSYK